MSGIIIVEDEREIADLLELYLLNDGFAVRKFHNAADALAGIEADCPDLLLLDIMLPDADGFSVCRKIRERYYFPIIMLTARTGDDDKISLKEEGDYMNLNKARCPLLGNDIPLFIMQTKTCTKL